MAGDWIKMRGNLWDDPRVAAIVDATDSSEAAVVGGLYWLWAAADQHTEDGFMPGLSLRQIDRKTGVTGIGAALVSVGWIVEEDGGIRILRFDEHNGASAKRRCLEAKRKGSARKVSASNADKVRTKSGHHAELEIDIEKEKDQKQEQDQKRGAGAPTPAELFPDVDPDHLRDWLRVRNAKRLPLTETAAKAFRKKAEKAGMTAAEAVKFCAEKGWAGLYTDEPMSASPRGSPPGAQPVGKQMQGLMALEARKRELANRMAGNGNLDGPAKAGLPFIGSDAGG